MKLNIQLFASGTITGTSTASIGRVQILWSSTASDAIQNKSSVTATVQVKRSTAYNTTGTFSGTLWINGTAFSIKKKFDPISNQWKTIDTKTIDVQHNDDGTKTIEIKTSFSNTGTSMAGTYTASENVKLDDIARASVFNSFTMSVNNDSSISVSASITKRNTGFTDTLIICDENIVLNNGANTITFSKSEHTTAYNKFYSLMGNNLKTNYTATLRTTSGTTQIGNTSSLTAYDVALPNYSFNVSSVLTGDENANVQTTNYQTSTKHYVSEFAPSGKFLNRWSKPYVDYNISATHDALYGNDVVVSQTNDNMDTFSDTYSTLGVKTHYLDMSKWLTSTTKYIFFKATDGRKTYGPVDTGVGVQKINWETPSVSIALTRESTTGQRINWTIKYFYVVVSRTGGNLSAKLSASYTYNGTTYTLYDNYTLSSTTGTLSGSFNLANADDYKYPISAVATLTDMIDYRVSYPTNIPSGQPAIYVHKDSSSNNVVDIYGTLGVSGNVQASSYNGTIFNLGTNNSADTWVPVLRNNYLEHRVIPTAYNNDPSSLTVGNASQSSRYRGYTTDLNNANQSGWYRWNNEASNHPWSTGWGIVEVENDGSWIFQTAYATYDDEYSRIAHRGYINGSWTSWSYVPTKDYVTPKTLYDNSSGTNGDVYLSETSANFSYIDIQFRTNDGENFVNSQRIYDPNGKYATLLCSYTGDNNGVLYQKARVVYINGTSISTQATNRYSEAAIKTSSASASKVNNIYITKVMGYR